MLGSPEKVFSPGRGRIVDRVAGVKSPEPCRLGRFSDQSEIGFFGCLPALLTVAGYAAGDDVAPFRSATARTRNDVVIGEVFRKELPPAILALEAIPQIDILSRESNLALSKADEADQPDHRRYPHRARNRMHLPLRFLNHLDFAEEKKLDRPLPVDDI